MFKGKPLVRIADVCARVTGYYRPVAAWNAGKQREHLDRRMPAVRDLTTA